MDSCTFLCIWNGFEPFENYEILQENLRFEQFYLTNGPKSDAEILERFHHSKTNSALTQRLTCFKFSKTYLICLL